MSRHLWPIAFCTGVLASAGCSDERRLPTDPTPIGLTGPAAPSPPPPSLDPNTTVTVEFSGRVVNADTGGPVEGVRVSVGHVHFRGPNPAGWVDPKDTATSGGDGTFTLPLNLPMSWESFHFQLTAPGYDDTHQLFWATAPAARPAIRMYPTLVITAGESIEVRVQDILGCGWGGEAGACRRVLVAASPGDPVELELVPDDSSKPMGLSPDGYLGAYSPERRLVVPPGGFLYVIGDGTARLTARR